MSTDEAQYDWSAFWQGVTGVFSLAGLVMCASFLGFGALVRGMGYDVWPALLTTLTMWALPGQVVVLTLAAEGAGLVATALAVSFTAIRLLPMVTLVLARTALPGTAKTPLYFLAHFIAVTLWVLTEQRVVEMKRERRLPWLTGLGCCLMVIMLFMNVAGYYLSGIVPLIVAAALAFMSPCFFFISLFSNAKKMADYLSIVAGALLVPICLKLVPDYDLAVAGLLGGTLAYMVGRFRKASA
jgi:predicted branched-subunit amino acid permease